MTLRIVKIVKSNRKNKRYKAVFNDGTETHFGDNRYHAYVDHHDKKRKSNYQKRHQHDNLHNPKSAGSLSYWVLWSSPSIIKGIENYKKKFDL